ncbi:Agamous-like MADS-box protein AGL82, partial [Mucuna pruriens]
MGRPKLILKPISNRRERDLAFMKRKKALMKKMSEFSTVCGVKACLIMYDGNGDAPPLTWPQDPNEVHSIIERYEGVKNEKLPKNFDLNNFFENKKNMVEGEISKVQKETLKIKYPTWHPCFNNLGIEELRNFMARLDIKLETCNRQRMKMLRKHQIEAANFNLMQCMVQSESAGPNPTQLNFMQNISQNQLILAPPMMPLNDGNLVTSYLLNLDRGSSSQSQILNRGSSSQSHIPDRGSSSQSQILDKCSSSQSQILDKGSSSQYQMLNFDPNLMQLREKNKGVVHITNHVDVPLDCTNQIHAFENSTNQLDVPLDCANQIGAFENSTNQLDVPLDCANQIETFGNSTNQLDMPIDLTTALDECLDYFSQLCEIEDLTGQFDEVVNWTSQPDESINWLNQHSVPVIGGSTKAMNGATNYDTNFHGYENNPESSLCNYNGGIQSMQSYNYNVAYENIASQSQNVTLPPPVDGFQTNHYNMLQNPSLNQII